MSNDNLKRKIDEEINDDKNESLKKIDTKASLEVSNFSLNKLKFVKLIDNAAEDKSLIFEATYNNERTLVMIEKKPFNKELIEDLLEENSDLEKILQNDIYSSFLFDTMIENKNKLTIIHPATDKHFLKYMKSDWIMIEETPEDYNNITLPFITDSKNSIEWVYNILDHKQEAERIVFEDDDPINGFILLPDLKWDGIKIENFYLVAIIKQKNIKSIRDLTGDHLDLLNNIKTKSKNIIKEKYDINSNKLQIYFHYQPSYYHLHIHFVTSRYQRPRLNISSSHSLETVITNLEIDSNYYKKAKIIFRAKSSDQLSQAFLLKKNTI